MPLAVRRGKRTRRLYVLQAYTHRMKSKVTAAELARIAGVTASLVREYAKELRTLVQDDEVPGIVLEHHIIHSSPWESRHAMREKPSGDPGAQRDDHSV